MRCEEEERGGDADSDNPDPFILEGLSSASSNDDSDDNTVPQNAPGGRGRLANGKAFRESLKRRLFRAQEKRRERRAARRAEARGL